MNYFIIIFIKIIVNRFNGFFSSFHKIFIVKNDLRFVKITLYSVRSFLQVKYNTCRFFASFFTSVFA